MSLQQAFVGSLAIESAENYAVADVTSQWAIGDNDNSRGSYINDDEYFWREIGKDKEGNWGRTFAFNFVCVSEWIARVPGLYWSPGAKRMRNISPALVEMKTEEWTRYYPPGKTQKVAGGVGTLRLPPNDEGYRVVALTMNANASAGVPALVSARSLALPQTRRWLPPPGNCPLAADEHRLGDSVPDPSRPPPWLPRP